MKRLLAAITLMLSVSCVHASMIWVAIAVAPDKVKALTKDDALLASTLSDARGAQAINLDKAWHGIHFLLNGDPWKVTGVAGQAILGGKEFGDDMGYGPARAMSAADVKKVAEALDKVTAQELSARYNPQAMDKAEIYPTIWERDGQDGLKELLHNYAELRAFYQRAANQGNAVIIAIM